MPRERQISGNEKRLSELGALAKIFSEFQGPQIQQAELAQRGQQNQTSTMLQALGLSQQQAELRQRESAAQAANDIAMRQLGFTEQELPVKLAHMGEETKKSELTRELAPQQLGVDVEKNAIEREKLKAGAGTEGQKRLVDILTLLTDPQTSAESQALIGTGIQGQPGMEQVSGALQARETARQTTRGNARAPGLAIQQRAAAPQGGGVPLQNMPGEIFGRSVVDLIPNMVNSLNPILEGAVPGTTLNLGRIPSWWEAYKRTVASQ